MLTACSEEDVDKQVDTGLSPNTIDNEAFMELYPDQYESYMGNSEMSETTYGGSVPVSKFDESKEPLLPILFNDYGFSKSYNEDRGHTYALEDITKSGRVTEKTGGGCLSCKSTAAPKLAWELGETYYHTGNLKSLVIPTADKKGHDAIGCSDCHDPVTMELRVTRQPFIDAMAKVGVDVNEATTEELRTYVCAQCHSEYYFPTDNEGNPTSKVTHPWENGKSAGEIYDYYSSDAVKANFTKDFKHNISATPIVKAQHPDFETFTNGTHGEAGVACADCHMPYVRNQNGEKYSSHTWTSPLKNMSASCGPCHSDREMEALEQNAIVTQKLTKEALDKAEETSVIAHYYANRMITVGAPVEKITEVQTNIREGQWYWDYVAAENSTGFHDPQGSIDNLMKSIDYSNKAIQTATEELVKLGVSMDELNSEIEKTVEAVVNETNDAKKAEHAVNRYFPAQNVE